MGGVPISVERQAQELVKLGHQVTVFAPMYESDGQEQNERLQKEIQAEDERSAGARHPLSLPEEKDG